jgi:hypothetical protein
MDTLTLGSTSKTTAITAVRKTIGDEEYTTVTSSARVIFSAANPSTVTISFLNQSGEYTKPISLDNPLSNNKKFTTFGGTLYNMNDKSIFPGFPTDQPADLVLARAEIMTDDETEILEGYDQWAGDVEFAFVANHNYGFWDRLSKSTKGLFTWGTNSD